jgi:curli biogenesis system outer membrane secretion channel CsgG
MTKSGYMALAMCAFLLLCLGCATRIPVNMIQPAEYHQASLTKTVAVLPFSGKGGVEFGAELEGLLTSIDINGHPYFTVVDRVSIDKVVSELKLSQSALADSSTAVKLGQIIGAQGIYTGAVTVNNVRDNDFRTQRSECVEYQMKRDEKGNLHQGSCIRWRKYYVNCTRRQANVSVTPKLIDVATSKILYSKNISGAAESSGCEDGSPPQGKQELLDLARQTVKNVIPKDIAPDYVTTMVKLRTRRTAWICRPQRTGSEWESVSRKAEGWTWRASNGVRHGRWPPSRLPSYITWPSAPKRWPIWTVP